MLYNVDTLPNENYLGGKGKTMKKSIYERVLLSVKPFNEEDIVCSSTDDENELEWDS